MVVSASPIASEVGAEVLEAGGNAVDAAVAVGFALAVAFPEAGNIGGGGFMLIYDSSDGRTSFIDFREKAPLAATRDMYLDENGDVIPGLSTKGIKAVGVPGTVAGLYLAHRSFGSLPWRKVLEPSVRLAENGFVVGEELASRLRRLELYIDDFPGLGKFLYVDGRLIEPGDTLRQQKLGMVLRMIADEGPQVFYSGAVADMMVREMEARGGLITYEDLRRYRAIFRRPVSGEYRGYRVVSSPPPSSGGVVLLEILNVLEGFDLGSHGRFSPEVVHLVTEAERRAFRDRAVYLGDPDFVRNPVSMLTSMWYADSLRKHITPIATPSSSLGAGEVGDIDYGNTTHYSIVDCRGDAVAVTTTLNSSFGSKVVVSEGGFLLNNEMDDFAVKPGFPNLYGLVGGDANSIEPGKRMLSSMCPTFVFNGDDLFLVLGTPGGSTIITTVAQLIVDVVDFNMSLEEAVASPRYHHQWLPDIIECEDGAFSEELVDELSSIGYRVRMREHAIGDVQAVSISDSIVCGVSDPRGMGEPHACDCIKKKGER